MTTETLSAAFIQIYPLNRIELISINALLAYAAYKSHTNEVHMRTKVASRFGVADIKHIPNCDYDAVVEFLTALPK